MEYPKDLDMKKTFIILFLLLTALQSVQAQTWSEWTKQKKTQRKYLMQQIAALKVYGGYVREGYRIARKGLNTIGSFKRGEFSLHTDFFNSLKTVNPKVRRSVKVGQTIELQLRMVQEYNRLVRQLRDGGILSVGELDYLSRVFGRLMVDCSQTIDALVDVTTSGALEMTDDQRLSRIDALHSDMQQKYTFLQGFTNDIKLLALSRKHEEKDVKTGRALHGIKKEP
jgi:hypothetical protein